MTKDERDRLVRVEEAVAMIPEMRGDIKKMLAKQARIEGYFTGAAAAVAAVAGFIGALLASFWDKLKALF